MKFNLTLLLIFLFKYSFSQFDNSNKNLSSKILNAKNQHFTLEANKDEHSEIKLLYDTIEFRDMRYDTSFIAMNFPLFHLSNTYNYKINLANGFASGLSKYMNDYYIISNKNTKSKLICFVKKFSITLQYDMLEHFNAKELQSDAVNRVNIDIDCYYQHGDTLFPAVRFDTSFEYFFGFITNMPARMKDLLNPLMKRIEQINIEHVSKRKTYTEVDIDKRYSDRFTLPVLKDTVYKKGVYKTFAEFKNNSPSINSFTLTSEKIKVSAGNNNFTDETSLLLRTIQKRNTAIYLYNESGQLITPSEIFGFCDGTNLWIQHGAFFYQLVKTGNAFEFIYAYHLADSNKTTYTYYILMPLNMETGKSN